MSTEPGGIWVVVPTGVGLTTRVIAELMGEAKRLADGARIEAVAVVLGGDHAEQTPDDLASWGAARILRCHGTDLDAFHPERFAVAVGAAIRARSPRAVLFPGTTIGVDLGLRVSLLVERRFLSGCVDFAIAPEHLRVIRPTPDGAAQTTELITKAPYLVSLIPETVGAGAPETSRAAPTEDFQCPPPGATRLRDCGFAPGDPKTMDLTDADIIIAGGRGLGSAEGFAMIEAVAGAIGGSVGASRPAVEAGWAPYERQVGQTGRTVRPKLYMACGISGASQHLAGMRAAKTIITVNTDPSAPVNAIAKLAIIGDAHEILEALARMLRERAMGQAA